MPTGTDFQGHFHPLNALSPLKYVVICTFFNGRYLLSRHRKRATWETQGGHIEPGEAPDDAARRELFEESGITDADIFPVCDYFGFDSTSWSNGRLYAAVAHALGDMPDSEMKEARLFDALPEALTYPSVTPAMFEQAARFAGEKHRLL